MTIPHPSESAPVGTASAQLADQPKTTAYVLPRVERNNIGGVELTLGSARSKFSHETHTDIRHACRSFGHLVKRGESLSFANFADRIQEQYSLENPSVKHMTERLRSYENLAKVFQQPNGVVLVSKECGVFLGQCLGLGFWSKLDPAGQDAAATFESEDQARAVAATWESKLTDLYCVPVVADAEGFASVQACVDAGLPAWDPLGAPEQSQLDGDSDASLTRPQGG